MHRCAGCYLESHRFEIKYFCFIQEISVLRSQVDKLRHVEEQLEFLKEENQRMVSRSYGHD